MANLTRREFLKMSGAAVGTLLLPQPLAFSPNLSHGRTLRPVSTYAFPNSRSAVTRRLWPDTVVRFSHHDADWLRISEGYIPAADVQPMELLSHSPSVHPYELPYWAQIAGPAASVYSWCDLTAPLMTRIGHSGIMQVIDRLQIGDSTWLGLSDSAGHLLGWTPAVGWEPLHVPESRQTPVEVLLDPRSYTLAAFMGESLIVHTRFSTDLQPSPAHVALHRHSPALPALPDRSYYGIPWPLTAGEHIIAGAYWHNQFGSATPGSLIQLPPQTAKTLYESAGLGSTLTIITN